MSTKEVDTGAHITRVGDLEHAMEFLQMVMAQEIDGKAVDYPHRLSREILSVKFWSGQDEQEYLKGHEA